MDKAGQEYWEEEWSERLLPKPIDPSRKDLSNYARAELAEFFRSRLGENNAGRRLLEIGCARSVWMPYFSSVLGFEVVGLDYSPTGCDQARAILDNAGVLGEVICVDAFAPPEALLGTFDVVVSFGVVEHFADTAECLRAFKAFLKPHGMIITLVPNLTGAIGLVQKLINRRIYDIHVPLDAQALASVHKAAGIRVLECPYVLSTNFGVNNLNGLQDHTLSWHSKRMLLFALKLLSRLVWITERRLGRLPPSQFFSPYVICVGIPS